MDLFSWLPKNKLNVVDLTYPSDEITGGWSPFKQLLGQKFKFDKTRAAEFSDTSVATLSEGTYMPVRLDSAQTAAIGTAVRGRPVFWADEANFVVTTDAATTGRFAGYLLETVSAKGNMTVIQVEGRVQALFDGTLTKGVPALSDLCIFKIASGVATMDVLADATAVTCAIAAQHWQARSIVAQTVSAGTATQVILRPGAIVANNGVM